MPTECPKERDRWPADERAGGRVDDRADDLGDDQGDERVDDRARPRPAEIPARAALEFVPVCAADAPLYFALRRAAITAGCSAAYPAGLLQAWTDPSADRPFDERLPFHFYFAQRAGRVVGSGLVDATTGRLRAHYVLPEAQGQGVGGALLDHLAGITRAAATPRLTVLATLNAVGFYRARGFQGSAAATWYSRRGVVLPCVPMTLAL